MSRSYYWLVPDLKPYIVSSYKGFAPVWPLDRPTKMVITLQPERIGRADRTINAQNNEAHIYKLWPATERSTS